MTRPEIPQTDTATQWEARLEPYHVVIVFAAALLIRIWIIHAYPIIFGGDSIVRLYYHDRVLISYQLPALQSAVHLIMGWANDPVWVRYFMAFAGAAASAGLYYLCSGLLGRLAAFPPAVWFAIHPFVVAYSTVPYQEILMLTGLFFGFSFFFRERWGPASLCLGLACLSRYEAWGAAAILAATFWMQRERRPLAALKGAVLFGWAPMLWIGYHQGLSPGGSFVLDAGLNWDRFWRWIYLGYITVKDTPFPVLILAAAGVWLFWKQRLWQSPRYLMPAAYVALFAIAILFSGHGERENPDRWVTAREAHILFAAVVVLAGLGFSRIRRARTAVWIACIAVSIFMTGRFITIETSEPHLRLSYALAKWADANVSAAEQMVVLPAPFPDDASRRYLDNAERTGGAAGRRQALELLAALDPAPADFQRTVVHSKLDRTQLRHLAIIPLPQQDRAPFNAEMHRLRGDRSLRSPPEWLAVWSDFKPSSGEETELLDRIVIDQPVHTIREGAFSVQIFRLD
ncbi:MAG TPA: hypothetical protein VML01_06530 [Bryobacterales bacterium]|nr:hypothetical protein [Bryobacterales bacterium]